MARNTSIEEVCCICQDNQETSDLCHLTCSHVFHGACILPWIIRQRLLNSLKADCPVCRAPIHLEDGHPWPTWSSHPAYARSLKCVLEEVWAEKTSIERELGESKDYSMALEMTLHTTQAMLTSYLPILVGNGFGYEAAVGSGVMLPDASGISVSLDLANNSDE